MKNLLRFDSLVIVLSLVFLISSSGISQNLLLESAGASSVNGIYLLDGMYNGKNKYTQDILPVADQHIVYWDGVSHWNISLAITPEYSLYYASIGIGGSKYSPPLSGWTPTSKSLNPPPTIAGTALPVELVSFSAHVSGESVMLNWRTESEVNNYGFDVERSTSSQNSWEKLGFVQGNGNSNSPKEYSFKDNDYPEANVLIYRLKQIDNSGIYEYSNEIEVSLTSPDQYSMEQNYPNPFNPSTKIHYKIAQSELVKLSIYNLLGKEVSVLVNEIQPAGSYSIIFSAGDLPGGVYFYSLSTDHFSQTGKMILLK